MSKALPIAVAVILGGAALVPVYYATQHPATVSSKASANASAVEKISYALANDLLKVTISGNSRSMDFIFRKED